MYVLILSVCLFLFGLICFVIFLCTFVLRLFSSFFVVVVVIIIFRGGREGRIPFILGVTIVYAACC